MKHLIISTIGPVQDFIATARRSRDLVEEFRALIVDSVVLTTINKHMLTPEDFEPAPQGGFHLKARGMKKFLLQYGNRLQTLALHPLAGRAITYQKCFEVQAWQMRHVIEGKIPSYQPYLTK
jgi:CRISPR-associated protein Cas1